MSEESVSEESSLGDSSSLKSERVAFDDFLELYRTLLSTDKPLQVNVDPQVTKRAPRSDLLDEVLNSFIVHLRICDDMSIAIQLVETLSVLSLHGKGEILSKMTQVSWTALHKVYLTQSAEVCFRTPFAFLEAVRRSMPTSFGASRHATPAERAVISTIVKTSASSSREFGSNSLLVNGMLRHWGLIVTSRQFYEWDDNHLSVLFKKLETFLEDIHGILAAEVHHQKRNDTSDEDEEYHPPQMKRKPKTVLPLSSIPGLTGASFPVYYEVLLHMVVATVAVSSPVMPATKNSITSPFLHFERLAQLFGSLIAIYKAKFDIFPRRSLTTVFNSSRCMSSVIIYQLNRCVEWRNRQPMLYMEEIAAGVHDVASIRYIQRLLDSFGTNVVENTLALCDFVDSQSSGQHIQSSEGDQQKVNTVRFATEKVLQSMQNVALSHSLDPPRMELEQDDKEEKEPSRKRDHVGEVKGFDELDLTVRNSHGNSRSVKLQAVHGMNDQDDDSDWRHVVPTQKKARRDPGDTEYLGGDSDSTYSDIDDESSDSSWCFGASGDWGEEPGDDHSEHSDVLQSPSLQRRL
jgi:hypothetical protein